jgi:membrane-bound ClpP family serine protease
LLKGASLIVFLAVGVIGILLLLVALFVGDHLDGALDALGGGDWFTGAALAGFLGGAGFVGAAVLALTDDARVAAITGLIAGLLLGFAVGAITMRLKDSGFGATPTSQSLAGLIGTVVSDIPADGYGTVSVVNAGHLTRLNARAGMPLQAGTQVTVVEVLSPTSVKVIPTYR